MVRPTPIALGFLAMVSAFAAVAADPTKQANGIIEASTPAQETPAEPYEFRGAKLGITLDEFRSLPYPDLQTSSDVSSARTRNGTRLRCSGDKDIGEDRYVARMFRMVSSREEVACAWLVPPETASPLDGWDQASIMVGKATSLQVFYSFGSAPDGELRLYAISIVLDSNDFDTVVSTITAKSGPPSIEKGKNLAVTARWDNGVSKMQLAKNFPIIGNLSLRYEHKALSASIKDAPKTKNRQPGN